MQNRLFRTILPVAVILCTPALLDAQRLGRSRAQTSAVRLAPQSAFFPLEVGNRWTYSVEGRAGGGDHTIRVLDSLDFDGVTYYDVDGLVAGRAWLRFDSRGRLVQRREGGSEQLWYDFAAPVGGAWTIDRPDLCFAKAAIESRTETVKTPAGVFTGAVVVDFGPEANCADAGLDRDVFAPGVGLVERTGITIAGPLVMRLREANIDGKSVRGPGFGFGVRTDRTVYTPDCFPVIEEARDPIPTLRAEIILENSTGGPLELTFNTGQKFDVVIRNDAGEEVWRWSEGRAFTFAIEMVDLQDVRTWEVEKRLGEGNEPWPAGVYTVEAELTNAGPRRFAAMVSIILTDPVF